MIWYARIALFLFFTGFALGISLSYRLFTPPSSDYMVLDAKKNESRNPSEFINIYGVVREIDAPTRSFILEFLDPYTASEKILLRIAFADKKNWTITETGNILINGETESLSIQQGFAGRFTLNRQAGVLSIASTPFQATDVTSTPHEF